MDTFLETPKAEAKPKKKKKKAKAGGVQQQPNGIHVHVNVSNNAGHHGEKKSNPADDALTRMRGY